MRAPLALAIAASVSVLVAACNDPKHPACDIPQLNCDSEFSYDSQKMGGGFSGFGVSFNANTEKQALRQVDTEIQQYAAASRRLCDEYNKCVIDKETYSTRSENLRRRMAKVPELLDAVKNASNDEGRRKALANAYEELVPEERRTGLEVDFSVLAQKPGEGSPRPIRAGEALPTGTKVSFTVRASRGAYLYVFQKSGDGKIDVLFPDDRIAQKNPVPATSALRIPDGDQSFKLNDKDIGMERVFVAASLQRIPQLETRGEPAALAPVARASSSGGCTQRALELEGPAPSGCARTRGLELASDGKSSMRTRAEAGDDTIVQVFAFDHTR